MKLCKNCKYCRVGCEYYCSHPKVAYLNPVTGALNCNPCELTRKLYGVCGKEGKLFEQTEQKKSFWYKAQYTPLLNWFDD